MSISISLEYVYGLARASSHILKMSIDTEGFELTGVSVIASDLEDTDVGVKICDRGLSELGPGVSDKFRFVVYVGMAVLN